MEGPDGTKSRLGRPKEFDSIKYPDAPDCVHREGKPTLTDPVDGDV